MSGLLAHLRTRVARLTGRQVVLVIIAVLIALVVFFAFMDRWEPNTRDAHLQTYVAKIAPQVGGRVVEVYVENNQQVKKGDPLFQLDSRPYQHQVQTARAELVRSEFLVRQLEADADAARERVADREAALVYSREKHGAFKELLPDAFIPKLRVEEALSEVEKNAALRDQAQMQWLGSRQILEAEVDGENVLVRAERARLAYEEWKLGQTSVFSPVDGYVTNMTYSLGSYARTGETMLTLVDMDNWWISAQVKENNMERVRVGLPADVSFALYPGKVFRGVVQSAVRGVNLEDREPPIFLPYVKKTTNWVQLAQRFPVFVVLQDYDEQQYPLRVGATALVTIYTDEFGVMHTVAWVLHRVRSLLDYIF